MEINRFCMFTLLNRILVVLFFTIIVQVGCYPFINSDTSKKVEKKYGMTQVPFNGKWWHYYERGLSYETGGLWKEAEADFRAAIRKRNNDCKSARTYGRHWININNKSGYFPHRELGIVLYRQGFIEQAIEMLNTSIKTQPSTRAKIYLDRVRKIFIKQNHLDASKPRIDIVSPQNLSWTNVSTINVEGVVNDDTFVQNIQIDNKHIYIDHSKKRIRFNVQKPLIEGKNVISIMANDLSGKQNIKRIIITVDYIGPTIRIEKIVKTQSELICKGSILDNSGIESVTINDTEHLCSGKKTFLFYKKIPLQEINCSIDINAIDIAGNTTSTNIPLLSNNSTFTKKKLFTYNEYATNDNMMILTEAENIFQKDVKSPEIILKRY
ncbi:hypothetical protein MHK_007106, partial [Candidatus Magnetomorum sp. HK-1]